VQATCSEDDVLGEELPHAENLKTLHKKAIQIKNLNMMRDKTLLNYMIKTKIGIKIS
jgi:hypothetical protein